jgi:hypothetical protein
MYPASEIALTRTANLEIYKIGSEHSFENLLGAVPGFSFDSLNKKTNRS